MATAAAPVREQHAAAAVPCVLAADIGGTFARFGLIHGGALLGEAQTVARAAAGDLPGLCRQMRERVGSHIGQPLAGAAVAIAAPVAGGRARMTNAAGWEADERSLAAALAVDRVVLVNDFVALALALPALANDDVLAVPALADAKTPATPVEGAEGAHAATEAAAVQVVFGPGTGLGVAALVRGGGRRQAIASEGGHVGFAPESGFEWLLLAHAEARFGRVSWERLLSGSGLELIDEVSRREFGLADADSARTAGEIVAAARAGACPAASHSLACFAGLLGSFGGDLALMFGADRVVIGGGLVARIAPLVPLADLRRRFCRKGRFAERLAGLPLAVLTHPDAALRGAASAFAERYPDAGETNSLKKAGSNR